MGSSSFFYLPLSAMWIAYIESSRYTMFNRATLVNTYVLPREVLSCCGVLFCHFEVCILFYYCLEF